jgi:SAM-dependent methyltransferase
MKAFFKYLRAKWHRDILVKMDGLACPPPPHHHNGGETWSYLENNIDNIKRIVTKDWADEYFSQYREKAESPGTPSSLFQDQEQVKRVMEYKELLSDFDTVEAMRKDVFPIPATIDREGYCGNNHLFYWLSGLLDYKVIINVCEVKNPLKILDFGGASGRVARHFLIHHPDSFVTVADININHVNYINHVFSGKIKAVKCSSLPSLPFPDGTFDLIYGVSVFTHTDVYETSWLAELARILKPNGKIFLTVHSEHTWDQLPNIVLYDTLKNSQLFRNVWKNGEKMPNERLVFPYREGIDYSCNTFFRSDYLRRIWGKFFSVDNIIFGAHAHQTGVVLSPV